MANIRIWIDDKRPAPFEGNYTHHFKWFSDLHRFLRKLDRQEETGLIEHISFDYVLLDDPSWPRGHEKFGDKCVELFWDYKERHATPDCTHEFHSSDPDFNKRLEEAWAKMEKIYG